MRYLFLLGFFGVVLIGCKDGQGSSQSADDQTTGPCKNVVKIIQADDTVSCPRSEHKMRVQAVSNHQRAAVLVICECAVNDIKLEKPATNLPTEPKDE